MKKFRAKASLVVICLLLTGSLVSCRSGAPNKANTARAVDEYFHLKNVPYAILFGREQLWGDSRVWPLELYPLDYRAEFERNYSGEYAVFKNESGEWQIAGVEEMEVIIFRQGR